MKCGISSLFCSGLIASLGLFSISAFAVDHSSHAGAHAHEQQQLQVQSSKGLATQTDGPQAKRKGQSRLRKIKQRYAEYQRKRHEAQFERLELRNYIERNSQQYGDSWKLANEIATFASKMIEKHYAGTSSIKAGAHCLKELHEHWNDASELREIRHTCKNRLLEFKKFKRIKQIAADDISSLNYELDSFFRGYPQITIMINRALHAEMQCSIRGGTIAGAWFVGGSLGAYRLKCQTPLGRRMFYGKVNVAGTFGIGGDVTFHAPTYEDRDGHFHEKTYSLPMDSSQYKPTFITTSGLALGVAKNHHHNQFISQHLVKDHTNEAEEVGAGLGGHMGLGLGNLVKVKDIKPDFRELFGALELGFY